MLVMWKLVSVRLEIVLISRPDMCPVCAKCTIGSEICLGIPDGNLSDIGQVEAHFIIFGDSINLDAR
jgi:hypothetical protein